MKNELMTEEVEKIILIIRNKKVIIDSDLAKLYDVSTKRLNEQVRRNIDRFPSDFMFELTKKEKQEVVANCDHLGNLRFSKVLPLVFTEQGVAMLSGILNSKIAIEVNIQIMRAFVAMRKIMTQNLHLFNKVDLIEKKLFDHDLKFDDIFKAIEDKRLIPDQGIFYDGQFYDAHKFVSDLIRTAKKSIVLIDNYVDDKTLTTLSKRNKDVKITIKTAKISDQLRLDVEKFNEQYGNLVIERFTKSHDRFLIIDETEVYHIGASLKDLGKRMFAFSKMNLDSFTNEFKLIFC